MDKTIQEDEEINNSLPAGIRDDLSNKLIHLTKGTPDEAKKIFKKIISESQLLGSNNDIRGGDKVICFSEAPISKLGLILAYGKYTNMRYMPYGFMFEKNYLFEKGARPVIYQTGKEFDELNENQKYRHVRYEHNKGIDHTWEREWRLKTDSLILDPENVTLIVPSKEIERKLHDAHASVQTATSIVTDGMMPIEAFTWHIVSLSDLGFDMSHYL
ncbi:hypothetical protein BH09PAT2_BH09PAT2_06230 [soil metagenome]